MVGLRENLPLSCELMKVSDKTKTNPIPVSYQLCSQNSVRKKRKSKIPAFFKLAIRTFFQEND